MEKIRLGVAAWVHKDGEDDYPFFTCLGDYPDNSDGFKDAEELVQEILKSMGSRDLTDYRLTPLARDPEVCTACVVKEVCGGD